MKLNFVPIVLCRFFFYVSGIVNYLESRISRFFSPPSRPNLSRRIKENCTYKYSKQKLSIYSPFKLDPRDSSRLRIWHDENFTLGFKTVIPESDSKFLKNNEIKNTERIIPYFSFLFHFILT